MPCPRTRLLSACLDPEWIGRRRDLIQAHVATCPVCTSELRALRAMAADLQALPDPVLTEDFSAPWRPASADRRDKIRRFGDVLSGWLGWLPAGVAVTASLAIGIGLANWSWPAGGAVPPQAVAVRLDVFNPVPPGGLCAAAGLCGFRGEPT